MTIEELHKEWERRNKGKVANSEHDLQVSCVNWFRIVYRQYSHLLMTIPNGGYRTKTTARIMRAEGQLSGVPDMFLAIARCGYHGLWIEMKNGKAGRLSDNQKDMIVRLEKEGYACRICRTREEFESTINSYLC